MRTRLWISASLTALALAGTAAVPAGARATVNSTDTTFLRSSHQGNLAEIAAGLDARKNATTACVKRVGAILVRDHTRLDRQGKAVADRLGVKLPTGPTAAQRSQLAAVTAKARTGAYDTAWLRLQDKAHRQTLALIDKELRSGENSQVKAAARAARPVVAAHLRMVAGGRCHVPTQGASTLPSPGHSGSGTPAPSSTPSTGPSTGAPPSSGPTGGPSSGGASASGSGAAPSM